jgi:hypothetical protein
MKLTALQPDNPIAWMAACGALRLLPGARLRWENRTPELEYDGDILATLAALPAERLKSPEIQFGTKLGATMDDAAWQAIKMIPHEWTLALGAQSETGMRSTHLKIRPGDYDMLRDTRALLERLTRLDVLDKLSEALQGPWRYEDAECVAWGWDAAARIDAAAIASKAERAPKPGVLGAYWLGWEALPLFPTIAGETRGWSDGLRYPTWSPWLDYPEVKALMLGLDRLRTAERKALGVRLWFARYLKTHVSSGRLSWAVERARTPSSTENPRGSRSAQATGFMIV